MKFFGLALDILFCLPICVSVQFPDEPSASGRPALRHQAGVR